jgi:hypothetical protein
MANSKDVEFEHMPFDDHVKKLMEEKGLSEADARWSAWCQGPQPIEKRKVSTPKAMTAPYGETKGEGQ